jgi:ABC-type phosphate transport system substrate-binding protein
VCSSDLNPDVRIDISAGGTGKGIADVLSGNISLAMVSRGINEEEVKNLAFFMLSTGKLFVSQNRPVYSSTFELKYQERPFCRRLLRAF